MINPKYICIFAGVGFFVSFIIGLLSGNGFLHPLLIALIFAVVFALLSLGIQIVYNKFLTIGDSYTGNVGGDMKTPSVGSVVNITVDDDNLPDEEQAPKFYVENNRPGLGAEDLTSEAVDARNKPKKLETPKVVTDVSESISDVPVSEPVQNPSQIPDSSGFTPMSVTDLSKSENGGVAEAATVASNTNNGNARVATGSASDSLDDLPDIGDFSPGAVKSTSDVISDASFSPSSTSSSSSGKEQNSELMAQAIRTILANDN
jgi:hypothetical protein